ncbi:unnamed protein product [Linum trigynum]|uniref:Uncharacterized protein n=1 Tax=Linum trigynum TaxID=586398 RepID=A0AAV2C7Q0_9ROSI
MAVNEDPAEGSIPSISLESLVSTQNGGAFSTEDIAWADSCLVKDPDISAGDWSSINDALLQVLSLAPESQGSLYGAMNNNGCVGGTDDFEMLPPDDTVVIEQPSPSSDDNYRVTIGDEPNLNIDNMLSKEEMDVLCSLQFLGQDPETFKGDWNSMREYVDRILSLRPNESGSMMTLRDVEDAQPSAEVNRDFDEETKMKPQHVDSDTSGSFQLGTLLSTYEHDNPKETDQSGLLPADTASSAEDAGVTSSEIFKLWDLGIPSEEEEENDELKLNRALADSSIQSIAPVVDDSEATRDLKEGALDYLIAGIGDLSIHRHSG